MGKDKTGKLKREVKEKCAIRVLGCTTVLQIVENTSTKRKKNIWKKKEKVKEQKQKQQN